MKKIIIFLNLILLSILLSACGNSTPDDKFKDYIKCSKIVTSEFFQIEGSNVSSVYEYYCKDADYEKIYSYRKVGSITRNNYKYELTLYVGDMYSWKKTIYYDPTLKSGYLVFEQYINKSLSDDIYSYIQKKPVFEYGVCDADFYEYDFLKPNYSYREQYFELGDRNDIVYVPIN